jgi:hypothetical protein
MKDVQFDQLHYTVTPLLLRGLTSAHYNAGEISGMRFSYYGRKRLEAEAKRARISEFVLATGHRAQPDEIDHVLAGDLLPPTRRRVQDLIRRAALLVEAVEQYAQKLEGSTATTFAAYYDLACEAQETGATSWSKFAGQDRRRLLDLHHGRVQPDPTVAKLYAWLAADPFLCDQRLLRAAVLYWALSESPPTAFAHMAVRATLAHELRAGRLDGRGLFAMEEHEGGREALAIRRGINVAAKALYTGDLTPLLDHFSYEVGRGLSSCGLRLEKRQDTDDRLPWMMLRPPDEMDRKIFETIERRGSAKSAVILEALPEPRPPLRTLQRRLQKLAHDGLLVKHGSRKDAFYRVSERG